MHTISDEKADPLNLLFCGCQRGNPIWSKKNVEMDKPSLSASHRPLGGGGCRRQGDGNEVIRKAKKKKKVRV